MPNKKFIHNIVDHVMVNRVNIAYLTRKKETQKLKIYNKQMAKKVSKNRVVRENATTGCDAIFNGSGYIEQRNK